MHFIAKVNIGIQILKYGNHFWCVFAIFEDKGNRNTKLGTIAIGYHFYFIKSWHLIKYSPITKYQQILQKLLNIFYTMKRVTQPLDESLFTNSKHIESKKIIWY